MVSKVSSILSNFLSGRFYTPANSIPDGAQQKKKKFSNKSSVMEDIPTTKNRSYIQPKVDYFIKT